MRRIAEELLDLHADEVANFQKVFRRFPTGPGEIRGSEHGVDGAHFDAGESGRDVGDEPRDVIAFLN